VKLGASEELGERPVQLVTRFKDHFDANSKFYSTLFENGTRDLIKKLHQLLQFQV
jgi:hypothetical protein